MIEQFKDRIFNYGKRIFVSGIITDKLIDFLKVQKNINDIEIIVKDFTRIFCKPENIDSYFKKGGKLKVVQPTNIIAITVNPTSPSGYNLNSKTLIDELKKHINFLSRSLWTIQTEIEMKFGETDYSDELKDLVYQIRNHTWKLEDFYWNNKESKDNSFT